MIGILSHNYLEDTTDEIIDWLDYEKADWIRINGDNLLNEFDVQLGSKTAFPLNLAGGNLEKLSVVWNRRWMYHDFFPFFRDKIHSQEMLHNLIKHIVAEYNGASRTFFHALDSKKIKWVSHYQHQNIDKINVLRKAIEIGLRVPETLITTTKSIVEKFKEKYTNIITKSIGEATFFTVEDTKESYAHYTNEVDEEVIKGMSDFFFPSLFQENIEKEFEIRSFFFDNEFYSMAIFSQNNEQTKTDFRRYDSKTPNRNIPFKLPLDVENKLKKLIELLKLDNCSIDLIKSNQGEYVFLEVNSRGLFGMTSQPCNYFLERKLAQYLKQNDNGSK